MGSKKFLILIYVLFLSLGALYAQHDSAISIQFDSILLKEALVQLETESNLKFYFQESWLEGYYVKKTFVDSPIFEVIDQLLKNTSLNYFNIDNRVILLKNLMITSSLPLDYFNPTEKDDGNSENIPIFKEEFQSGETRQRPLVSIGKQSSSVTNDQYSVNGRVINAQTGAPIEDLVISTKNRTRFAITDSLGAYDLLLEAGHNVLETELLGYKKIFQPVLIYGSGTLDIELDEELEMLDEVVVRSNRDVNVRDAVIGASSIDIEAVKTVPLVLGERDLLQVATTLPGIKKAGEGSSGLNIRGGRTDQNLVLLDDGVIYNPTHFLGLFSAVNPFTTQSLQIYKASIPAEYGGRLSSVIDIETKAGNTEKIKGEGSIGPVTGNLMAEVPLVKGKSSIIAGVRATYAGYILDLLDESSLSNSDASFFDATLKYSDQLNEKNLIEGSIYYSRDELRISSDSLFSFKNQLASLKWNHQFNSNSWASVVASTSNYGYNILYDSDANSDFNFGYRIDESFFQVALRQSYAIRHKLDYGLSTKLYKVDPGTIIPLNNQSNVENKTIDREKGVESAIYVSDLYEINSRWLLDLGLRYSFFAALGEATQNVYAAGVPRNESSILEVRKYENNEIIKTYGGLEYRLSARYLLGPDISLKAGFNRTLQYIHLLTNNTTQSPTDIWKISDLNVKPQRADQLSVGIFKNIPHKNVELSLEGYYKKMNNLLDYKIGAQLILVDRLEAELLQGNGKAHGIELLIKKTDGKLNGHFGYSYSRAFLKLESSIREEEVNNGLFFPANFDKPHDLAMVTNYRFTKRYSMSFNFIYQTGRPVTYPVGKFIFANQEHVLYSDRNQFRIPDYYRLDLGVNIEGNHKKKKLAHSFINISVYNVLGRNNPYSVFFVNEEGRIKAYQTSVFAIPIPTITYNFKF